MLMIGDVFLILFGLGVVYAASAAMVAFFTVMAPRRAARAADRIVNRPWRTGLTGLGALLVAAILVIMLIATQQPLLSIIGFLIAGGLFALSALGRTGLALAAARRIGRDENPGIGPIMKAVWLSEGISLLPIFGWLIYMPAMVCLGLGAAFVLPQPEAPPFMETAG
jgi:hypothetical protein